METRRSRIALMRGGFTLMELLIVVTMIAILAAIAVPNFLEAQTRAKLNRTVHDMAVVQAALEAYYADHLRYPPNSPSVREWLRAAGVNADVETTEAAPPPEPEPAEEEVSNDPFMMMDPAFFDLGMGIGFSDPAANLPKPDNAPKYLPQFSDEEKAILRSSQGRYERPNPEQPQNWHYYLLSGYDLQALTTPVNYFMGVVPDDPFHDYRGTPFTYLNLSDVAASIPDEYKQERTVRYLLLSTGPNVDMLGRERSSVYNPIQDEYVLYDPTNGTISPGDIVSFGRDINYSNFRGGK